MQEDRRMNRMKRWIALLLAGTLLAGVLTSCGGGGEGTSLSSEDTMPLPETTLSTTTVPEPPEGTFALTQDGRAMFQFVFCSNASAEVISEVEQMTARLNGLGAQTQAVADYRVNAMQPCEILIGADVRYRDEFSDVDVHTVGIRGYIIKAVGERVMIAGGSDDALLEGLHFFAEHYLGVTEDSESLPDVRLSASLFLESVTDDYAITSLTLAGEDIRSYQIAADHARKSAFAAAQNLQAGIYMYTGAWLEIVDPDEAGERQIRFSEVSDAGSDGFRIRVEGTGMHVESSYHNSFEVGARAFVDQVLVRGSGDLVWDETLAFSENISVLHYSQFGAVGDGITDDTEAIQAAFDMCPEEGMIVFPSGTYMLNYAIFMRKDGVKVISLGATIKSSYNGTVFLVSADRIIIDGFSFIGSEATPKSIGVYFQKAQFCTVQNCYFYRLWRAVQMGNGRAEDLITLRCHVLNNYIAGCLGIGVCTSNSRYPKIAFNKIRDSGSEHITLDNQTYYAEVHNNTMYGYCIGSGAIGMDGGTAALGRPYRFQFPGSAGQVRPRRQGRGQKRGPAGEPPVFHPGGPRHL